MDNNKLLDLHQKYISDQMLPEELDEWKVALCNPDADHAVLRLMDDYWLTMNIQQEQDFSEERLNEICKDVISHQRNKRSLWPRISIAATLATILLSAGIGFYKFSQKDFDNSQLTYINDIGSGKQAATLTLGNGQRILIKDALAGNIANQSGVKISKTTDGQIIYQVANTKSGALEFNTLSTSRGEYIKVRLPDGSLVYLNSASSLSYASSLIERGNRVVKLLGEGYFEVSKDKEHPFVLQTGNQEIEVLGTHFNVMAYPDEPAIVTTLLEGSVKINSKTKQKILKPGEQAVNDGASIQISNVNADNVIDWKNNEFVFSGGDFRKTMRKIARWYDVEIFYDPSVPSDIQSWGYISRNSKISDVLKLIESTGQVHFKIEGRRITVTK